MWLARRDSWHPDVTAMEKFLAERIIQRCDYSEIISNKHRSSNGYTQLKELIQLCALSHKRSRTIRTLIVLLEEALSNNLKQNIRNDLIINQYFSDLRDFIQKFDHSRLLTDKNLPNLSILQGLEHKLKLFEVQLEDNYFLLLKKELLAVDYTNADQFQRRADRLSILIDLLVPYLIFKGYSIASIREELTSWLINRYHFTIKRILDFFHGKTRPFQFLQHLGQDPVESNRLVKLMEQNLQTQIIELKAEELGDTFVKGNSLAPDLGFAHYELKVLDPHNHIRSNYDALLKQLVLKRERESLAMFNNFFSNSFWSHSRLEKPKNIRPIALEGDPVNVESRGKTFRSTLIKCSKNFGYVFIDNCDIPITNNFPLNNAVYYYNLALGSKSIENSLSLLWTTLESIIPYRLSNTDIECVQHTVCTGLGIGSISRDIQAFIIRFMALNHLNNNALGELGTYNFASNSTNQGLMQWFDWIKDKGFALERFNTIKDCSELLAYQYTVIGKMFAEGNLGQLLERINYSENSMKYQLQRIYLHRNQIVHSADLVNEYSNLWMHLEWYVGKLLAYFFIQIHFLSKRKSFEDVFREIEADREYLVSYLLKNKNKSITDLPERIRDILFNQVWQSF